jgi:hypothetical protein
VRKKLLALVVLYAVNKHHSFCRKLSWIVGITTLKPLQVDRISHSAHQDPEQAYIFRYLGHLSIGQEVGVIVGWFMKYQYLYWWNTWKFLGICSAAHTEVLSTELFCSQRQTWALVLTLGNSQMHPGWHCWYLHLTGQPLYFKVRVECIVFHYPFITLYQHHLMLVQYSEQLCSELQTLI